MDLDTLGRLTRIPPRLAGPVFRAARRIPAVRRRLDAAYAESLADLRPDRTGAEPARTRLPAAGLDRAEVLARLEAAAGREEAGWRDGGASGAVYHGDPDHIEFVTRAYALHSQSNPLHADLWPATVRFEAEMVAMTAALVGGEAADDEVVGTVTSGGTESIILAMKAYRDRAGRRRPEVVVPESAHVAFDKAARLLGITLVRVPVGSDGRARPGAMERAMSRRTIALAGSAPGFPHGVIDPIPELADLARRRRIGFHTDACLGGFVLPFAERLGAPVPVWDFRLPGVTSLSIDTHKYGYAPKGTSIVLYRGRELRRHQYFTATDWPGGLYYSPTLAGSRPGGLSAAAWAALVSIGEDGYTTAVEAILDTAATIRAGIEGIEGLEVIGDPLWVIAFTTGDTGIYAVHEAMTRKGWSLNGLHQPPAVHLAVTLRHTRPGVADRFITDLGAAVAEASRAAPGTGTTAPVYGMAASFPARGLVAEMLERYVDSLYDP